MLKLKAIRYNCLAFEKALAGIQLVFTSGYETPFFETKRGKKTETKTVLIDPKKAIHQISMLVSDQTMMLKGLRLIDSENECVLDETWGDAMVSAESEGKPAAWIT